MRARILFFGLLKDVVGRPAEEAEFAEGADLQAVFDTYASRFPRLREMSRSIVMARNQEFGDRATPIQEGDEIAFLPPVSGGAGPELPEMSIGGNFYALTRHAIDTHSVIARLMNGAEGAVVTFEGTVRNNTKGRPTLYLDYECYESMALKMMARIGEEIAAGHEIGRIAMVHRLGRMLVGETSVAVIVTSPHRRAAFDAALDGINRLKKLVPIWKKEHFVDGEVWVEGEWDEHVSAAK
ncbi:MAG TPA: molybdenum cofactor biosynthesis protein MoaE [Candidatus Sulfopaludibacter sp.]|jgi:molybdopterin synthase catalytic subunit|nr:molybdenum cofactor biosynthesis protein MoaE [Candidatus Sulfopaludibacter sp.]